MEAAIKELRELGNPFFLNPALTIFGTCLFSENQLDEGEKLLLESLDFLRKHSNFVVYTLTDLARLAYKRGDFRRAETLIKEADDIASRLNHKHMKS